jgi:cytoskeletal protein CcmA (bactofilin family)
LQGALHVDGRIDGIVETRFDIVIGPKGSLTGLVKARSIYLSGQLEGKVACERIEILSTGKLMGELISGELTIESGGKFVGHSRELDESGMILGVDDETQSESKPAQLSNASVASVQSLHADIEKSDSLAEKVS